MSDDHAKIIREMIEKNPLLKFSVYTSIQCTIINDLGNRIAMTLAETISSDEDGIKIIGNYMDAYGQFWLWVLGAYEIIRTMAEAKRCFDDETYQKIKELKGYLAYIRMPFAKQRFRGDNVSSIRGVSSISNFCAKTKDFSFEISGKEFYVREVMQRFRETTSSIGLGNIRGV